MIILGLVVIVVIAEMILAATVVWVIVVITVIVIRNVLGAVTIGVGDILRGIILAIPVVQPMENMLLKPVNVVIPGIPQLKNATRLVNVLPGFAVMGVIIVPQVTSVIITTLLITAVHGELLVELM